MSTSAECYAKAVNLIPGGVNSPVRAFGGVGGDPLFIESANGPFLYDVSGNEYIDYVGSWGPMIVGHAHQCVLQAVSDASSKGLSFGAPTKAESRLAEKICSLMPNLEKIRMVNSGTEATMTAVRLARGFTKRNKILKFAGCYHGHLDALLVSAGSGNLTYGVPSSAGVPANVVADTLIAEFNNIDSVVEIFAKHADEIAAIIVEPVAGNMNCILPVAGFLQSLRDICDKYGSLLIFDEVMTGFRVALGGAQSYYNVTPDLTTLGKVIGGGMPVGACGGRADIMDCLSPVGNVYQAGTLSGNPIAMAAGLATLDLIASPGFYEKLTKTTRALIDGLVSEARVNNILFNAVSIGGMFGFYFSDKVAQNLIDVQSADTARFKYFFQKMLNQGIYFAPSAYEAGFVSNAHTENVIEKTINAAGEVFKMV